LVWTRNSNEEVSRRQSLSAVRVNITRVYLPCTCISQIWQFWRFWRPENAISYVLSVGLRGSNPTRASNLFKHLITSSFFMGCTVGAQCFKQFHGLERAFWHIFDVVPFRRAHAGMPQEPFGCQWNLTGLQPPSQHRALVSTIHATSEVCSVSISNSGCKPIGPRASRIAGGCSLPVASIEVGLGKVKAG